MKKVFVALFALILSMPAFNAMALGGDGRLNRGFRGFVNVTTNFGIGSHTRDNYQLQSGFTGGYQINQHLFVGGGLDPTLNLNAYHNDDVDAKFVLPLFSAIRFDVLDKQFTPFVEGRLGYCVKVIRILNDTAVIGVFYLIIEIECKIPIMDSFSSCILKCYFNVGMTGPLIYSLHFCSKRSLFYASA